MATDTLMPRVRTALMLAFLAAFCLPYATPVYEGDFFHHLRTGQLIYEQGNISPEFPTQWLGQLLIFAVWKLGGFDAVVIARTLVYAAILALLAFWMRKDETPKLMTVFYLLFPASMFLSFPSERPQIFSFLLFPLTVFLLERQRTGRAKHAWWMLPVLIVLWANMHAGFTLGVAAVWIYLISAIAGVFRKINDKKYLIKIGLSALLPLLIFAVKPSLITSLYDLAKTFAMPNIYTRGVQEYLSPIEAAKGLKEYYPAYWGLLAVSLFTIVWRIRSMPIEHMALLVFFGLLPFKGLRFMPFFTMLAPIAAVAGDWKDDSWTKSKTFAAGFAVILMLWLALIPINPGLGIGPDFPVKAVEFLKSVNPRGVIFNYQGWGGYINWAAPEREIFIPVSNVREDVDQNYDKVIWALIGTKYNGKAEWRALIDAYKLDIIFMPGMSPVSGEMYDIVDAIQKEDDWFLIYSDGTANILVKSTPENGKIITNYSLPKSNVFLQIESQAKRYLKDEPKKKVLWRTLGEAYVRLGRGSDAKEAFQRGKE